MSTETSAVPRESLTLVEHGLFPIRIHANLTPPALLEHALRRSEGQLTDHGAFTAVTSPHTGRSPKDKFVIEEPGGSERIWWEKNPRLEPAAFERLHEDVRGYLDARDVFVQDLFAGADMASLSEARLVSLLGFPGDLAALRKAGRRALRDLEDHISDRQLAGYDWVEGERVSIADLALFPYVTLSHDAGIGLED